MKVVHVVRSLGIQSGGGVSSSVYNLSHSLWKSGIETELYAPDHGDETYGRDNFINLIENDVILQPLAYSSNFRNTLKHTNCDIYHLHAVWGDIIPYSVKLAHKRNKPCILSLHGGLMASALSTTGLLKRAWWRYVLDPAIKKATCVHATSEQEYEEFRLLGYKNPVAVVPNVYRAPLNTSNFKKIDNKFRVGYLGRLHPHKQIELLIEAWKQLPYDNGELVLIGEGNGTYTSYLKQLAEAHRTKNIHFIGFKEGVEKFEAIAQCDLMCLPSKSENFGMVVPESLSVGVPVWASSGSPWQILEEEKCGWCSDATIPNIMKTIVRCKELSIDERVSMVINGKRLINKLYSPLVIANQMIQVYSWMLDKINKPSFLYC